WSRLTRPLSLSRAPKTTGGTQRGRATRSAERTVRRRGTWLTASLRPFRGAARPFGRLFRHNLAPNATKSGYRRRKRGEASHAGYLRLITGSHAWEGPRNGPGRPRNGLGGDK